jgi:subtilase family serine protease
MRREGMLRSWRSWTLVSCVGGTIVLTAAMAPTASASPISVAPQRIGTAPQLPASSQALGALPATSSLQATVTLNPPDPAALASYATAVSTPGSADYGDYLSPAEFARRFAPSAAQITAVRDVLEADGLNPGAVSANDLSIQIHGTVASFATAFDTSFNQYQLASGRTAYANTSAPLLPASIAATVQGVIGLNNLNLEHHNLLTHAALDPGTSPRSASPHTSGPQPCAAATAVSTQAPSDGYIAYTANELASAYNFSGLYTAGDLGAGQTVALYELEPNSTSDISAFQTCYGTSATVSYEEVDGGAGSGAGSGEAALDIETVIAAAPDASELVYQAPNTGADALDEWTAIISQDKASIVSTSWGICEAEAGSSSIDSENTLFEEAATQGQSIVDAAGDNGAEDCGSGDDALAVDDPGAQPFITAVGGLTLTSSTAPPAETVWNESAIGAGAGGGGISEYWTMPSYQSGAPAGLNVINTNSSGTPCGASAGSYCREVPDVSLDADPETGYIIEYESSWQDIGGTSAAAPLFAGFLALTNASTACDGHNVGFANPGLYSIAGKAFSANFYDVTSGNNDYTGTNGGLYPAGTGYDMASGLGAPNGTALAASLCSAAQAAPVFTTDSPPLTGTVGTSYTYTFHASGNPTPTYAFGDSPPSFLSINSTTGVVSGTPTTGTTSFSYSVIASNGVTPNATAGPFTVTVSAAQAAPVFTTDSPPLTGTVGTSYTYTFHASGNPTPTYAFGDSPPSFLSINSTTGVVSGTPTTGTKSFSYSVIASNGVTPNATAGPFTVTVSAAAPGPKIDAEASATGANSATVSLSTRTAGDLIVAYVAGDGPASGRQTATVSRGGLTWTLAGRTNAGRGTSEIWSARARGILSKAAIKATLTKPGYRVSLTVVAYSGASGVGAHKGADASRGAPTASLTTTHPGSWVFAVGNDWDRAVDRTLGPNQTLVSESTDAAGDSYWVQSTTTPTASAKTRVRINDTAPITDGWNLELVEIL